MNLGLRKRLSGFWTTLLLHGLPSSSSIAKRLLYYPEHQRGMCFVNKERKLCFVNIPKNASMSVRDILLNNGFKVSNYIKNDYTEYLSFTVWRDPLRRFVSGYLEILRRYSRKSEIAPYVYHDRRPFLHVQDSQALIKFEEFISEVKYNFFDEHIQSQCWFIEDWKGNQFKFDHVFRLESLNEEWKKFVAFENLHIPDHMKWENSNTTQKSILLKSLRENTRLSQTIEYLYAEDKKIWSDTTRIIKASSRI